MSHRKIEYLNDNRIIYKKDPVNDEPTYSNEYYSYYEDGTHEYYHLFNSNSKITDEISISNIIKNTFWKGIYTPKNRLRKIIFKDFCPLSFDEKMKIVGELVGKQKVIYEEDIYQCMIDLNELNKKITWDKVAKLLNCSTRTIHRNINKELKTEKIILNEKI